MMLNHQLGGQSSADIALQAEVLARSAALHTLLNYVKATGSKEIVEQIRQDAKARIRQTAKADTTREWAEIFLDRVIVPTDGAHHSP